MVVLEAGAAEWSTHWGTLPERISEYTTTIVYDRAGLGWSDAGPEPRTVDTMAQELHQLLGELAPDRNLVLVGHGFGAYVVRMYSHRYPFEIEGLVFVDGDHEGLEEVLQSRRLPSPQASPRLLRALLLAGRFGVLRALGVDPIAQDGPALPLEPQARAALRALGLSPRVQRAVLCEQQAASENEARIAALTDRFEVPLRVITSSATIAAESAPAGFPLEEFNQVWVEQNAELLELSPRSRQTMATNSDHLVQLRSPHLVLEAVREVLAQARTPVVAEPWEEASPGPK